MLFQAIFSDLKDENAKSSLHLSIFHQTSRTIIIHIFGNCLYFLTNVAKESLTRGRSYCLHFPKESSSKNGVKTDENF